MRLSDVRSRLSIALAALVFLLGCSGPITMADSGGDVAADAPADAALDRAAPDAPARALEAITIVPATSALTVRDARQFVALGRYSDGTSDDASARAAWESSDTSVLTIDATGTATAVAPGSVEVRARISGVASSPATVTVSWGAPVALLVSPTSATLHAGSDERVMLTATALYAAGLRRDVSAEVAWTSSDAGIAAVDSAGRVTPSATRTGIARIAAELAGVRALAAEVTVVTSERVRSLAITPVMPTVAAGLTTQLAVTGTFEDGHTEDVTARATWSSANESVALIGASTGLAQGVAVGSALITASVEAGGAPVRATTTVVVGPATLQAIHVEPPVATIGIGCMVNFTATGVFTDGSVGPLPLGLAWSSTTPTVATINSAGVAMGVTLGTTSVRAELGAFRGEATLVVTTAWPVLRMEPAAPRIPLGSTRALRVIASHSLMCSPDPDTDITSVVSSWTSSDPTVADVSSDGIVTARREGTATITATYRAWTATATVTVGPAVVSRLAIVASTTTLADCAGPVRFTVNEVYSDGTTRPASGALTWTSSDPRVATVDDTGLVTPRIPGTATITVESMGLSAPVGITVISPHVRSVELSPAEATLSAGQTVRLRATSLDTCRGLDVTDRAISWTSSDPAIATVNAAGAVEAVAPGGPVTITATFAFDVVATARVTVTAP